MGAIWILFVLSFLSCSFVHVSSYPYQAPSYSKFAWRPKNYEGDVDELRSLSYGRSGLPTKDKFHEERNGYHINDADFDDEETGYFEANSIVNRKRSSASNRSFKNKAGYYLIEAQGHTVTGTKDRAKCNTNGVFLAGKTNGIPFIQNKASGWYLAIDTLGNVYMTPNKSADTVIRSYLTQYLEVYLYRIVKNPNKKYLYLDLSPQSSTVHSTSIGNTTLFKVRFGVTC